MEINSNEIKEYGELSHGIFKKYFARLHNVI